MADERGSQMVFRHIQALKELKGKTVEAGWFASDVYPNGMPVAVVARILNFGCTITNKVGTFVIPPRPFMMLAYENILKQARAYQKQAAKKLFEGKLKPEQILGQIGLLMEGEIVNSIKTGGWVPNSDTTINGIPGVFQGKKERHGDNIVPLIDTGHMWQTVSSKVSE